jgi:hypothetical protein
LETKVRCQGSEVRGSKVGGWRLEVGVGDWKHYVPEEYYHEELDFAKGSVEYNWVVDSIFELSSIHAKEAAYK